LISGQQWPGVGQGKMNRRQAYAVEATVGPCKRGEPHDLAGPFALPHYQPDPRRPEGHYLLRDRPPQSEDKAMKYFTQDLIARGQSHDDNILNEVEALWDANCDQYVAYLDSIRDRLPPGLRHRVDNYYLHDAVIRGMGRQGRSFVIIAQLDTPPQSIITFTYELL
jgi:hypothetical protein